MMLPEPITLGELKRAFDRGPRNKAPGAHCIVHEFYIHFWGVIKTYLLTINNSEQISSKCKALALLPVC